MKKTLLFLIEGALRPLLFLFDYLVIVPMLWLLGLFSRPSGDWRNCTLPPGVFISPLERAQFKMENARKYGTMSDYLAAEKEALAEAEKQIIAEER